MNNKILQSWIIIGASVLISIACLSSIPLLKVDSSTDAFIPEHAPVVKTNENIEAKFGSLDSIVVSLYAPSTMLTNQNLAILSDLTDSIATLPGVKQASSVTNLDHMQRSADGMTVIPLYDGNIEDLQNRIDSWPSFYEGTFLSTDRKVASILIQTKSGYDAELLLSGIRQQLLPVTGLESSILGLPVVNEEIQTSILSDLAILAPIVGIMILVVLFLFLRRIEAVFLSLVPLIFGSSLTLGIMAWTGITFTMATMLVPVLLLIVGSAYTIHIFSHFYESYDGSDMEGTLTRVVKTNTYPIIGSAATTAFGFLAQLSSPLGPFRTFGFLSFLGVGASALSALFLLPALIRVVYTIRKPHVKTQVQKGQSWLIRSTLAVTNRWGIVVIALAVFIIVVALPLSYRAVQKGTNMLDFFRPSSSLVQDSKRYNDSMEGSFSLSVMITPPSNEKVLNPKVLKTLEQAINRIEKDPSVGGTQSILPFIKRMNQMLGPVEGEQIQKTEDAPVFDFFSDAPLASQTDEPQAAQQSYQGGEGLYEIPSDPAKYGLSNEEELSNLIAQYLLLYSSSLDAFIDDPLQPESTLFTILLKKSETQNLGKLSSLIPTLFPQDWKVEIGGGEAVSLSLSDLVTKSQIISLFSSLLAVWILVILTLRSVKLATLALLPCLCALASVFGVMVIFSIKLNIVTSLIAALCIGIGVDYAIHLLSAFLRNQTTLETILRTTGKAIIANAASVALGFSGLFFSRFVPIADMGLLFCIAMASASLSALLLLIALKVHIPKLFVVSPRRKR